MYCTLESTLSNEELFLQAFPRKSTVSVDVRIFAVVRKKKKQNGGGRGKLANKFTPCSITAFLYSFYLFLPLRPREAGYQINS